MTIAPAPVALATPPASLVRPLGLVPPVGVVPAARWLPPDLAPRRVALVLRAMADIGVEEFTGHNDSPYITQTLEQEGAPAGSAWCAAVGSRWRRDVGAPCPPKGRSPSCHEWVAWAKETGRWITRDHWLADHAIITPGDAVLYQYSEGMHHETLVRVDLGGKPVTRVVGGNTSWSGYSREATCCTMKPANEPAIAGFVRAE